MCDKKVRTTATALKMYIKQLEKDQTQLDIDFVEVRNQHKIDSNKIDAEIKTAKESLSVLELQLKSEKTPEVEEVPDIPEVPEKPDDPTCPKCGNYTKRVKIKKIRGRKVQEWECLSCGKKFTAPLDSDGIPSEIGTRPGAGPKGPTGQQKRERRGVLDKARKFLDEELGKGRCILLQQIETETGVSQSAAWRAACEVTEKKDSEFEFYKDTSVKFHLKGVRPKDVKRRRVYCPGCKSLLIPGKTCKKCPEEGSQ